MEYFLMTHQWVNGKSNDYQEMIEAVRNINYKTNKVDLAEKQNKNKLKRIIAIASVASILGLSIFGIGFAVSYNINNLQDKNEVQSEDIAGDVVLDENKGEPLDVKLGDEVVFGKYNGVPIKWRVLKISEDKREAVLVSSQIISQKAFDAPDSDRYNEHNGVSYYSKDNEANTDLELQAFVRGNSDWENSDIRAWLNAETDLVDYGDSAPTKKKMCELKNGYETEPGFLSNFSDKEIAAIKTTRLETKGNELSNGEYVTTDDKVYLLSLDELELFEKAGMNILTKPTAECLEQDESKWYQFEQSERGTEMFYWWLREPVPGYSARCYVVGTEYWEKKIFEDTVGFGGIGIRPAITVDLTSDQIVIED
jgi:co-chaperonin GroES (HSP10)